MSACPYVFSFEIALIAVFAHYERGAAALSAHPPMPSSFEGIFERLLKTRWRSFGSTSTAGLEREFHVGSHRPSMIAELYRRLPREHLAAACRNKKIQASGGRGLRQGHATVHASRKGAHAYICWLQPLPDNAKGSFCRRVLVQMAILSR